MKKLSKIMCLTATVSLVISICGCKKDDSYETGISTVTVWSGDTHSKDVYEHIINDYNSIRGKAKDIKIEYMVFGGDVIAEKTAVALQSGNAPDLFASGNVKTVAEKGYALALNDLPGGEIIIEKNKNLLAENREQYKGKTYRVPFGTVTQGLIYNKDMFKEAGITDETGEAKPPETFDELRDYAKILTNPKEKKFGIIFPMHWYAWFSSDLLCPMQSAVGHKGYNPATGKYDYEKLVPIMDTVLGIKEDGSCFPGSDEIDNDSARAQFSTGNIGMKYGFSFDVRVLNNQFASKCDWGVAPYPVLDKNEKYMQTMEYGESMYIYSKTKIDHEKIADVYSYLISDEVARTLFKESATHPIDWELVKDINLSEDKKCWSDFAKIAEISVPAIIEPQRDMGNEMDIFTRFVYQVWSGEKTSEQMLDEYTKAIETGVDFYYSNHPEESRSDYIDETWNIRR